MDRIRAGVIGLGFIGEAHIEALRRLGNVDIVAIVDPTDPEGTARKHHIAKGYATHQELIDQEKPDIVHICTPNHTHFEIAEYALTRDVHVLCEKPMTATLEEAEKMVELARSKKLVAAVNYHNRFYPMVRHMKEMIRAGEIGRLFSIHGGYLQDWLLYDTDYNWRLVSSQSGRTRAISDIGSHWMDIAEYITGLKIIEVFADFSIFHKTRKKPEGPVLTFSKADKEMEYTEIPIDTEDFASIILRFENGVVGNATISQTVAGKKNKISFFVSGSEKSLEWDLTDLSNIIVGYRNEPNQVVTKDKMLIHPEAAKLVSSPGGHAEGFPDAFKQCFRQVYHSVTNPNDPVEYATFEDGYHQMLLAEKLYDSARNGVWVKVQPSR
ncbi:MAG TPA: Gfo/Idh/MocA family oxidoreductase [Clostridiaceae bacterium]|nr:Gfo/Idh/MocA family oxidoreductase [Clostridiaceae bacterium]